MFQLNIKINFEKFKLNHLIKKYGIKNEKVMRTSCKLDKLINQIIKKKWKTKK